MDNADHFSNSENPYRSPGLDTTICTPPRQDAVGAPPVQEVRVYRPADRLVRIVTILLAVNFIILLAAAASDGFELSLLNDISTGNVPTSDVTASNDERQAMIGYGQLLLAVLTAIVFCMWLHRANANARALGAEGMRFTPGWAVGFFFIPFLNLICPFQAVNEICQASDPGAATSRDSWRQSRSLPSLLPWWMFWLAYNILARLSRRMAAGDASIDGLINSATTAICADVFGALAAIFAILVVRSIQARQAAKYQVFASVPHPTPMEC